MDRSDGDEAREYGALPGTSVRMHTAQQRARHFLNRYHDETSAPVATGGRKRAL
jgi:hypothetical protein